MWTCYHKLSQTLIKAWPLHSQLNSISKKTNLSLQPELKSCWLTLTIYCQQLSGKIFNIDFFCTSIWETSNTWWITFTYTKIRFSVVGLVPLDERKALQQEMPSYFLTLFPVLYRIHLWSPDLKLHNEQVVFVLAKEHQWSFAPKPSSTTRWLAGIRTLRVTFG